jgi:uncharacterized membrane protein
MAAAVLALGGLLVSVYLLLHRLGLTGPLACGPGENACERVQASRYADFLGVPVAAYGVAGYLAILAVALVGLQPRFAARRTPTLSLVALAGLGVLFTLYLKYLEIFRIGAICRWCLVSAVLIVTIFGVSLAGLRRHAATAEGVAGR